jgi:hypothetical protein
VWHIYLAADKNIDKVGEGRGLTFKDAWSDIGEPVELPGESAIARIKPPL